MTRPAIGISHTLKSHRQRCEEVINALVDDPNPESSLVLRHLSQDCGEELARIVASVARWQHQARKKLSPPDTRRHVWWVTDRSLQQATPWQVARLKASWFGEAPVHDLCCGIGGDSIQLAARGEVTSVDLDPLITSMAEANLIAAGHPLSAERARCADITELDLPADAAIHLDPDRRPGQRRTSDPNAYQPSWQQLASILAGSSAAVIKLAPVASIPESDLLPASEFHRCWTSLSGTVREQSLLWGQTIDRANQTRGQRSAVVIRSDGTATWFAPEQAMTTLRPRPLTRPQAFLIDPNAAIRAAGLTEAFANQFDFRLLHDPAGFLAGDLDPIQSDPAIRNLAVTGEVHWWGQCDDRKLRKEFRTRNVFPATIKVRGTDHDPAALVKRYRRCGETPVTLWIGRQAKRIFAAITA